MSQDKAVALIVLCAALGVLLVVVGVYAASLHSSVQRLEARNRSLLVGRERMARELLTLRARLKSMGPPNRERAAEPVRARTVAMRRRDDGDDAMIAGTLAAVAGVAGWMMTAEDEY